jgi:Zn-dependent protease
MPELTVIQQIAVWIVPVLFAITFHEAAHGFASYHLGDSTAKLLGRLSLNPFKHVDPIGTVLVPLLVLVLSHFSFVFGWAKPVPINSSQFNNPRRDLALATAAGPLSNIMMAFLWVFLFKLGMLLGPNTSNSVLFIVLSARAGIIINLVLAFLNLIPIPPLDGSKIVASLLPLSTAMQYEKIAPYGFLILLTMMFTGTLNWLIGVPVNWSISALSMLFNV